MQNSYSQPYRVSKEHHGFRRVLGVLLLIVVAFAVCLGVSAYRLYGSASELRNQYTELTRQLSGHDYDSAASTALAMDTTASSLVSESQSWPWRLVAQVSYAKDDVAVVQGLASSAQTLTHGGLAPLAQAYQQLVADGVVQSGTVSLRALSSHRQDVSQLTEAGSTAVASVQTAQNQIDSLPASHIPALNSAKDAAASALSDATSSFSHAQSTASSDSWLSLLS